MMTSQLWEMNDLPVAYHTFLFASRNPSGNPPSLPATYFVRNWRRNCVTKSVVIFTFWEQQKLTCWQLIELSQIVLAARPIHRVVWPCPVQPGDKKEGQIEKRCAWHGLWCLCVSREKRWWYLFVNIQSLWSPCQVWLWEGSSDLKVWILQKLQQKYVSHCRIMTNLRKL